MIQRLTEELRFDDGSRRIYRHPSVPRGCIVEAARVYSFELFRKQTTFGSVPVDQFWMSLSSIYQRAGKPARNYDVVVEYFWANCMRELSVFDDEVMDSYILAKLLPYVRRNGSRRVFDDAVLTSERRFGQSKAELIEHLDRQLADSRGEMLNLVQFRDKTADLLGPCTLSEEVQSEYAALTEELLGEGRNALGRWGAPGLQVPINKFQGWMKSFARRSGNEARKLALDVLSYESRAAMHRCYSAVWYNLLTHLEREYAMDEASAQYHQLMHLDVVLPSQRKDANFHLFHGHVFALHPGISLFLQTRTGGELMADHLQNDGGRPFARLLHGLWVGLWDYHLRGRDYAQSRKKSVRQVAGMDLDAFASTPDEMDLDQDDDDDESQISGPTRRKKPRKQAKSTDANLDRKQKKPKSGRRRRPR